MTSQNEWETIESVTKKYEAPTKKDFGKDWNNSAHDTSRRNRRSGSPTRKCPARTKSAPLPRTRKVKVKSVELTEWNTKSFGGKEEGPGMSSGPVKPIGASQQQGPWEKGTKEGVFGEKQEPFIGINRRPKATKLPVNNEDLPGYNVKKGPYLATV